MIFKMLKIDGSYGEGGGQVIRTALALSTITRIPFEAHNIRKGRSKPGLKAQHINCVKSLEDLCSAKKADCYIGSERLTYIPDRIKAKSLNIDIGTAGSVSLLLQSTLLPSFFADKKMKINITGGTTGKWAMPYDFLNSVYLPRIRKYCEKISTTLVKRGYYPKGGGKIELNITPRYRLSDFSDFKEFHSYLKKQEQPINSIKQYNLVQVKGVSHSSNHLEKAEVADRQAKAAKVILSKLNCPANIRTEYCNTLSPGSGLTLWSIYSRDDEEINFNNPIILGADDLGEKGKPAEKVGKQAASKLLEEIEAGAAVDRYTADNLIPWLALFGGEIRTSEITEHTKTNIWVCEQFLGKTFEIDERENIIKTNF